MAESGVRANVETARNPDAFSVPRNSAASCFVERSAKLFDKGARRRQFGKAPAGIGLIVPHNPATVSRLNALRFMKTHDLPIQFDFQSGLWNSKLDDIRIPALVDQRLQRLATLIGCFVRPEEVAHAVIFIAENDALAGQVLTLDGGTSLKGIA